MDVPNDTATTALILEFPEITLKDLKTVGGKNSSLGELHHELSGAGIHVPDGFATTVAAYWDFLDSNRIREPLGELMRGLDRANYSNLKQTGAAARAMVLGARIPERTWDGIVSGYGVLCARSGYDSVAVRSSATAEDLPSASFAGQHDSFLNVRGPDAVVQACRRCYASLFTDRAIKYREDNGFDHMSVGLSVGVQTMVRSDLACAGVIFTIEPESGFRDVILISGSWGLGENVVQGSVNLDEFHVFKTTLRQGRDALVSRRLGTKALTMILSDDPEHPVSNIPTPEEKRRRFILTDGEITTLARWSLKIEEHYGRAMDIEWAKDGITGDLWIVQARPETVSGKSSPGILREYKLKGKGPVLVRGSGVGEKIAAGTARVLRSPADAGRLCAGEVLVTDMTNPDWDTIMKKASAIVTNKGGRTSHAAIVARELGLVAIVGTGNATENIADGQQVTVSCTDGATGLVYDGILDWEVKETDFRNISTPRTQVMLILGDPEKAYKYSFYPNSGVGLMRLEFIINNAIRIHPMALVKFDELTDIDARQQIEMLTEGYPDKREYFIDNLARAVGTIAAAFHPRDVIVRMSDFKTNEYANLIGGRQFEPEEENPMIGFRGASRYYNERYREGFRLECEAMKRVRGQMGLTNVKLMIPFCRTVEEGARVVDLMAEYGLERGREALEIYVMAEIPSNVLMAEEFARIFDGFSIGSNDLTQLTLGIDRDSAIISELFSERNPAVTKLITEVISVARRAHRKIGLCGQAPSDHPDFAGFLVRQGIDSISFNPDALIRGIQNINAAEMKLRETTVGVW